MKRYTALVLSLVLLASLLAGCHKPVKEPEAAVRVAALKGPTAMGLVRLMDEAEKGASEGNYTFTVAATADEVTPRLIQGELDLAAIPANLASVLWNNTDGGLTVLAVNTLGVLYLVQKNFPVTKWQDLRGQTVYCTGKGSTPEYTLRYLLLQNGLDPDSDVTLEFKSEPAEIVAALGEAGSGIAMLPQPYATVAQMNVPGLEICMDLTDEWYKLEGESWLITGVLVARTKFVEENPEAVELFLKEYEASVRFTQENAAEAAALIERFGIVKAAVAEKALPYCNVVCVTGEDMKTALSGYLRVLFSQNPKAVGGKVPADSFYYVK